MNNLKQKIEDLISQSQYEQAAQTVAKAFNLEMKVEFLKNDFHFQGDKDKRDIYKITLKRGQREYSFNFGQSINNSGFYAQYGKSKYFIPMDKISLSDYELKIYVKYNLQNDFGNVKNDKIIKPIKPTLYDVLSCLQKYDVGSFEDFCSEFGYDEDSRSAEKIYKAVVKEFEAMERLFTNEELEILAEIN